MENEAKHPIWHAVVYGHDDYPGLYAAAAQGIGFMSAEVKAFVDIIVSGMITRDEEYLAGTEIEHHCALINLDVDTIRLLNNRIWAKLDNIKE